MSEANTSNAFLSYSRVDQAFAAQLARDLRSRGIDLWFDQLDIAPGRNWDDAIHEALNSASVLLFLVSAASVKSENVLNEITVALDAKKSVIPLMLADVPVPLRIARMQRVNLTADYTAALNHLTAYLRGYGSRTTRLEAISAPPTAVAGTASAPQRSSLAPVHHTSAPPAARRPWLVPAVVGLGTGVVGLLVLLLIIGTSEPDPPLDPPPTGASPADSALPAPTANAASSTLPLPLQGKWQGACSDYGDRRWGRTTMVLRSTTLTSDLDYFSDRTCTQALYTLSTSYDVVSVTPRGPDRFAVDYRLQKIAFVPMAPAAALNREAALGQHWRDGEAINLSPQLAQDLVGYAYEPGMPIYDLLSLENGELHEGKYVNNHMALSNDERPLELDPQGYTRVEP